MEKNKGNKGNLSRTRLLEAATNLFAKQGFNVTKVSDIVKAAGLTQAAFYLYFPSKEAILTELVEKYKRQLIPLADSGKLVTPLTGTDVPTQAKENVRNLLSFIRAQPELTRIALYESTEGEEIKNEIVNLIIQNLRQNQQSGHVRNNLPVEVAAECMLAVLEQTVKKIISGKGDPSALSEDVADVLLYGILTDKQGSEGR